MSRGGDTNMSETGTNVALPGDSSSSTRDVASRINKNPRPLSATNDVQNSQPVSSADDENNNSPGTMAKSAPTEQDPVPVAAVTPAPTSAPTSESVPSPEARAALRKSITPGKPTTALLSIPGDNGGVVTIANDGDHCAPPPDFQGEVETNNELPSPETLRKIESYTVLDADGKSHTFKSLYAGHNVARRVMILFVRHFFCGVSPSTYSDLLE